MTRERWLGLTPTAFASARTACIGQYGLCGAAHSGQSSTSHSLPQRQGRLHRRCGGCGRDPQVRESAVRPNPHASCIRAVDRPRPASRPSRALAGFRRCPHRRPDRRCDGAVPPTSAAYLDEPGAFVWPGAGQRRLDRLLGVRSRAAARRGNRRRVRDDPSRTRRRRSPTRPGLSRTPIRFHFRGSSRLLPPAPPCSTRRTRRRLAKLTSRDFRHRIEEQVGRPFVAIDSAITNAEPNVLPEEVSPSQSPRNPAPLVVAGADRMSHEPVVPRRVQRSSSPVCCRGDRHARSRFAPGGLGRPPRSHR